MPAENRSKTFPLVEPEKYSEQVNGVLASNILTTNDVPDLVFHVNQHIESELDNLREVFKAEVAAGMIILKQELRDALGEHEFQQRDPVWEVLLENSMEVELGELSEQSSGPNFLTMDDIHSLVSRINQRTDRRLIAIQEEFLMNAAAPLEPIIQRLDALLLLERGHADIAVEQEVFNVKEHDMGELPKYDRNCCGPVNSIFFTKDHIRCCFESPINEHIERGMCVLAYTILSQFGAIIQPVHQKRRTLLELRRRQARIAPAA